MEVVNIFLTLYLISIEIPGYFVKYCEKLGHEPSTFLKETEVPNFKLFWQWTLDVGNGIEAKSSMGIYWRQMCMYIKHHAIRNIDPLERDDIQNVRRSCLKLEESDADVLLA